MIATLSVRALAMVAVLLLLFRRTQKLGCVLWIALMLPCAALLLVQVTGHDVFGVNGGAQ